MNQRIQKLAQQVGFTQSDLAHGRGDMLAEFARLIVRECARVSERTGALNEADYEGEMIADSIREYFGVER